MTSTSINMEDENYDQYYDATNNSESGIRVDGSCTKIDDDDCDSNRQDDDDIQDNDDDMDNDETGKASADIDDENLKEDCSFLVNNNNQSVNDELNISSPNSYSNFRNKRGKWKKGRGNYNNNNKWRNNNNSTNTGNNGSVDNKASKKFKNNKSGNDNFPSKENVSGSDKSSNQPSRPPAKDEGGCDFPRQNNYGKQGQTNFPNNDKTNYSTMDGMLKNVQGIIRTSMRSKPFQPLNSWVLQLHYRIACIIFFLGFLTVWYNWFNPIKDNIYCISTYNAERKPENYILNICLSYPYVKAYAANGQTRQYILFYRWVHYCFLLVSAAFYTPRFLMKRFGNRRFKSLLSHLNRISFRYNSHINQCDILDYYEENLGSHSSIYQLFILQHIICAIISCLAFLFLDFVLQGKFMNLFWAYPFTRDSQYFDDPLSRNFPPFVQCSIAPPAMNMQNERDEMFNCHLTLMEFYEKVFIFFWFFLLSLIFCGVSSVIFLFLMRCFSPCYKYILSTKYCYLQSRSTVSYLLKRLEFGDIFTLYIIKREVGEVQFYNILEGIRKIVESRAKKCSANMVRQDIFGV